MMDQNDFEQEMYMDLDPVGRTKGDNQHSTDYGQVTIWGEFLSQFWIVKKVLGMFSSTSSTNLGGLHHRGNRYYTLEFSGCLYVALFIALIVADIEFL